jgi:hypothetical protein
VGRGSGGGVEADGFSESGLTVVEGPELLRGEFEGAGNVQGVERADAEGGAIKLRKVDAKVPGGFGKVVLVKDICFAIAPEGKPGALRLGVRQLSAKDILMDRVSHLGLMERCDQDGAGNNCHTAVGFGGVSVIDVTGDQEA